MLGLLSDVQVIAEERREKEEREKIKRAMKK